MTDVLQKLLTKHLAALDRNAPDYPLLVKCYQALTVVYIPPEVDVCMIEWAGEMDDSNNLLTRMRKYWQFEHQGPNNIPSVAVGFVQAFYKDYRRDLLAGQVEMEYLDFIDHIRGQNFYWLINAAHEIDMKKQIKEFLTANGKQDRLDIEDIDLLLTLDHPLEKLYEACKTQDAMREAIEYSLDRVVEKRKTHLQTKQSIVNWDIEIYRMRYLSDREEVPFPVVSQMCEQLIARAEQELAAAIDGPPLPPEHVVRLHDTITFFREQGYTPAEAVVMLTYDHPFAEVLNRMEQGGLHVEFAFHCAAADRQAEMQQYIDRLDSLPAPLQKSVREYQERLAAVEVFCAAVMEDGQGQEWETEER